MRLTYIFWTAVALDAALFTTMLVYTLAQGGGATSSGGREMGIFFFIMVPVAILAAAVLLWHFTTALPWKIIALLIVAGPGFIIAWNQIDDARIDYRVRQDALGRGYFTGDAMKAMGAAVMQGDTATLTRLAPTVDINTVGEGERTLLSLSAEELFQAKAPEREQAQLAVAQTLLQLGAKPNSALDTSLKLHDPALLNLLLAAHANPNQLQSNGQPVVFSWLAVMPVANLRALIDHGLDVNAMEYKTPLVVEAALHQRWDLVALLGERGANLRKPRDDGRNVPQEAMRRIGEAREAGKEPAEDLVRVQRLLAN